MMQWLDSLYLGSEEAKVSIPANQEPFLLPPTAVSRYCLLNLKRLNSLALLLKSMLNVIPFYLYFIYCDIYDIRLLLIHQQRHVSIVQSW